MECHIINACLGNREIDNLHSPICIGDSIITNNLHFRHIGCRTVTHIQQLCIVAIYASCLKRQMVVSCIEVQRDGYKIIIIRSEYRSTATSYSHHAIRTGHPFGICPLIAIAIAIFRTPIKLKIFGSSSRKVIAIWQLCYTNMLA